MDTAATTGTATATPRLVPPTPAGVPSGWKVYTGVYIAFAYPPDWTFSARDFSKPGAVNKAYELQMGGQYMLLISESDADQANMDCLPNLPRTTVAGLRMIDDSKPADGRYGYRFIATQHVRYDLTAYLYPNNQQSVALATQIFNTLSSVYTTSACS